MEQLNIKTWQETKNKLKEYQKNYEAAKNLYILLFLDNIEMSENALKFGDVKVNKQEFHPSKQSIDLNLVIQD